MRTETELREQLATATRILATLGMVAYSGHLSARLEPGQDALLVQPFDDDRATLDATRLLVVDADGAVVDGSDRPPDELVLHQAVLRARPDVGAVAHLHLDRAVAFTTARGARLALLKNHAARWRDGIPVLDEPAKIVTEDQGRALAAALGRCHALLLRGHGVVLVAEDVTTLLADCVHFAENVEQNLTVAALGEPLALTEVELDAFAAGFDRRRHAAKLWRHYVGRLPEPG